MSQTNQTLSPVLGADVMVPRRSFRLIVLMLLLWLLAGSSYLYRQELGMRLGIWNHFDVNAVNYSRYADARDTQEVFQGQLIFTRKGYREGALFVGPSSLYSREMLPIDSSRRYRMSFELEGMTDGTDDAGSLIFAGVVFYDQDRNIIAQPQAHMFGVAWSQAVKQSMGVVKFSGEFSPDGQGMNAIPAQARYMKASIELNYHDPRASVVLSNVKFVLDDAAVGDKK